nr:hypothetical protein [Enterococcus faecalis]
MTAIASNKVDFPVPFSPEKKVIGFLKFSELNLFSPSIFEKTESSSKALSSSLF